MSVSSRRAAWLVILLSIFITTPLRSESIAFTLTITVDDQEVITTGGATYSPDPLCLQCFY